MNQRAERRSLLRAVSAPPSPPAQQRRRRAGLAGNRRGGRRRHRGLRIVLICLAVLSGIGLAGVGAAYAAYQSYKSQLPDAATLAAMEPPLESHVFSRDGTLIKVLYRDDRHEHAALTDISHWVTLATVDVEDKHFYEHQSWDLPRIVKAAWDNVRHSGTTQQGASTITEQLAKLSFLCNGSNCERSIDRKIKQLILGIQIEQNFSKDQILEMYLNRIPYGNHSIGVESAAQTYYMKSAKNLDLAEASMLAGLPNSPALYNPLDHGPTETVNPLAKQRQRVVLNLMVANGDISQSQADAAYQEKLVFHDHSESEPNAAPSFTSYLDQWLQQHFGDAVYHPGGWDIVTTLDLGKQALAEKTLHDGVQAIYKQYNAHDGALVSMDPRNGEVLAMVGAWDYNDPEIGQFNFANVPTQPGSTIKLFTYTSAIASRKFTMTTPVVDAPVTLKDGSATGYTPHNYDQRYHGTCLVPTCLGNSLNIPAVKVEAATGIPYITDVEIASGLTELATNRPAPTNYAATLGGLATGISPLHLVEGASMVADLGVHHTATPVLKASVHATGEVKYAHDPVAESNRVVPSNVAFIMNEITSNDKNRTMEFGSHGALTLNDRRVSAKTGTTDFFRDNWTVGWTPYIATAVLVGNPLPSCLKPGDTATLQALMNRRPLYSGQRLDDPYTPSELAHYGLQPRSHACGHLEGSTGITGAAPIWNAFMKQAVQGTPKDWYKKPADVIGPSNDDDGTFFLPGTSATSPVAPVTGCYYYGPAPEPGNPCRYVGNQPPGGGGGYPGPPTPPGQPGTPPPRTP